MPKGKLNKKKKVVVSKRVSEKKSASCSSWFWYALGILIILAAFFFLYRGMTGNAVSVGSFDLNRATQFIQPIGQFFLGSDGYSTQNLFERFLFFLIILSLIFVSLKKIPIFDNQKNIVTILSVIVSILSVRYINFEWLMTAVMTYSVLGVAIISFLPFVIYFFFLMNMAPNSGGVRKIGWILFGCIYLGMYFSAEDQFYGKVYIWTALAAVVFLFLDGTISKAMSKERLKFGTEMDAVNKIAAIDAQIGAINTSGLTQDQKKRAIENLYKQRQFWTKHLS